MPRPGLPCPHGAVRVHRLARRPARIQAEPRQAAHDCAMLLATVVSPSATRLRQLGLQPRIKAEADGRKFPFVLFAAPPSGSEDYPTEVLCTAQLLVLAAPSPRVPRDTGNC